MRCNGGCRGGWLPPCVIDRLTIALAMGVLPAQINEHLQTRVYMVGNEVTLADLVLLGAVQEAVVRLLRSTCQPRQPDDHL